MINSSFEMSDDLISIFENIPSGQTCLTSIAEAMRHNHVLSEYYTPRGRQTRSQYIWDGIILPESREVPLVRGGTQPLLFRPEQREEYQTRWCLSGICHRQYFRYSGHGQDIQDEEEYRCQSIFRRMLWHNHIGWTHPVHCTSDLRRFCLLSTYLTLHKSQREIESNDESTPFWIPSETDFRLLSIDPRPRRPGRSAGTEIRTWGDALFQKMDYYTWKNMQRINFIAWNSHRQTRFHLRNRNMCGAWRKDSRDMFVACPSAEEYGYRVWKFTASTRKAPWIHWSFRKYGQRFLDISKTFLCLYLTMPPLISIVSITCRNYTTWRSLTSINYCPFRASHRLYSFGCNNLGYFCDQFKIPTVNHWTGDDAKMCTRCSWQNWQMQVVDWKKWIIAAGSYKRNSPARMR